MKVLLIGAGGHARVIKEIIELQGYELIGFLDDNEEIIGQEISGKKVLTKIENYPEFSFDKLIFGVGSNQLRQKLGTGLLRAVSDEHWLTAIHPSAIISKSAVIGIGTVVMAGVIVNADAKIGKHAIINTASSLDHDCIVGNFCHIAPGVHLAGGVSLGEASFIGIGSCVIPNCKIGKLVRVGAGATVIDNIPDGLTVIGTPARPLIK